MKESRHGPARRWMHEWAVEWRWVAVRRRSMVRREMTLGMVVCRCDVVEMEKRENEMIAAVVLCQSDRSVLMRPMKT